MNRNDFCFWHVPEVAPTLTDLAVQPKAGSRQPPRNLFMSSRPRRSLFLEPVLSLSLHLVEARLGVEDNRFPLNAPDEPILARAAGVRRHGCRDTLLRPLRSGAGPGLFSSAPGRLVKVASEAKGSSAGVRR
jgi:hypothetical protein